VIFLDKIFIVLHSDVSVGLYLHTNSTQYFTLDLSQKNLSPTSEIARSIAVLRSVHHAKYVTKLSTPSSVSRIQVSKSKWRHFCCCWRLDCTELSAEHSAPLIRHPQRLLLPRCWPRTDTILDHAPESFLSSGCRRLWCFCRAIRAIRPFEKNHAFC
jgi:hypothetical protein